MGTLNLKEDYTEGFNPSFFTLKSRAYKNFKLFVSNLLTNVLLFDII